MVNPTIIPVVGFTGCSFMTRFIGILMGTLIIYLPAVVLIVVAVLLVRKGQKRRQKTFNVLAGFLLIIALGYRIYLSIKGWPLIFLPNLC